MEKLHGTGDLVAKAVATLGCDLLDGRTIWAETEGTRRDAHLLGRVVREGRFASAAVARVDPAIGSEDEVVGDEVSVPWSEAAEKDDFLVRLAVAVCVAKPEDVRVSNDDDAVFVMTETRDEFEPFMKELLLVGDAVAISVDHHANLILRRTIVTARHEHPALAPSFSSQRPSTVRIFRGLGDPHATALVPLDGDGLINQGLGGYGARLEARLHLKGRNGLFGAARAAGRITHVHEVLRRAKFIGVSATSRPSDTTLDEGTIAGVGQGGGVALQEDGRTEAGVFKDPSLRLDVVDRGFVGDFGDVLTVGADLGGEGGGEYLNLFV